MSTTNIDLDEMAAAQSQPEVPFNENMRILDAIVQLAVLDFVSVAPGTPADGDKYLVIATASGVFAGRETEIAYYVAGAFNQWRFAIPKKGWSLYNLTTDKEWRFNNAGVWTAVSPGVGIGT